MFDNLTDRLTNTLQSITGKARISESNIKDTLREVRMALLEADVALPVVKEFMSAVKDKALGQDVIQSVAPGQAFIKIVNQELVHVMGEENERLNLSTQPPAVILMAGLQGAGKTTSVAKLAKYLKEIEKKSVMVVSADVYRPAAIDQLETLAKEIDVTFFPSHFSEKPVKIARNAIKEAKKQFMDVLLVDTAGRLHIDDAMMREIQELHSAVDPIETLFVVDSMTGQDAANTAKVFNDALPLTGVILTKTDGDARGGAALSVRHITGKPIKFLGIGEKVDALQPFHPERVASRILGMGDVLSLVEEAEQKLDKKKTAKLAKKISKGKNFNLEDFLTQIQQMNNLGGISGLMDKLPGMGQMPDAVKDKMNNKEMDRLQAIIFSMTKEERRRPEIIKGSRKRRIAAGCGQQVQDVNRLLKQFSQMQKMMKKMRTKGGMAAMMKQMKGVMGGGGGLPFQ
ncbi:MAG TPA: signal recognition particle protein [Gammaproteobacteria bacterium]|nr:signal recognition particle protein [Gammaproteobacteria bacterium]